MIILIWADRSLGLRIIGIEYELNPAPTVVHRLRFRTMIHVALVRNQTKASSTFVRMYIKICVLRCAIILFKVLDIEQNLNSRVCDDVKNCFLSCE